MAEFITKNIDRNLKPREKCGIVAISGVHRRGTVAQYLADGLTSLQHRGQESCGMSVHTSDHIETYRDTGLVSDVFKPAILQRLQGDSGIGHVRYSTTGTSTVREAQPFMMPYINPEFTIAFNGTITNFLTLRDLMRENNIEFETDTDTEVIARLIIDAVKNGKSYIEAIEEAMKLLQGAYSVVLLNRWGDIYAFRDPYGYKPLALGETEHGYILSSETVSFDFLGAKWIRDIYPGEIVRIRGKTLEAKRVIDKGETRNCFFEWVYFARPDSYVYGKSVYEVRYKLGEILARDGPLSDDRENTIVVPVPETGIVPAIGFSKQSKLPFQYGIIMNRYKRRTFILPNQQARGNEVRMKLNPISTVLKGKEVIMVDDSIVRGTTVKRIIAALRNAGAKKVHVRVTAPPIVSGCYFGIDFPTRGELVASYTSVKDIERDIGADSLYYNTIDAIREAIGCKGRCLCLSCVTGEYPELDNVDFDLLETKLGSMKVKK